jgi:hypothetical protein
VDTFSFEFVKLGIRRKRREMRKRNKLGQRRENRNMRRRRGGGSRGFDDDTKALSR